jgi:uncharacterized protein YqeY
VSLKLRIQEDMKSAMRAGEKERLAYVRSLLAAIKQREIDDRSEGERSELDDAQVLGVIEKMIKQRRESIAQYTTGGRADLAQKEQAEIDLLATYLPAQLDAAELEAMIRDTIAATGAASVKDMGKVMAIIKQKAAGRVDMAAVGARIKAALSG